MSSTVQYYKVLSMHYYSNCYPFLDIVVINYVVFFLMNVKIKCLTVLKSAQIANHHWNCWQIIIQVIMSSRSWEKYYRNISWNGRKGGQVTAIEHFCSLSIITQTYPSDLIKIQIRLPSFAYQDLTILRFTLWSGNY